MARIIKVLNKRLNRTLYLTQQESKWQLLTPKGLEPTSAQINTTAIVGGHGSLYRSSRLTDRQIVLTLAVYGDTEKNILELYEHLGTNEEIRFYYRTKNIDVYIDGWVSNVSPARDSIPLYIQFAINCPRPFFKEVDTILSDWTTREDFLEFVSEGDDYVGYSQIDQEYDEEDGTYSGGLEITHIVFVDSSQVVNRGQLEVGMIIEMECLDTVDSLMLRDKRDTSRFFGLNYAFEGGDKVVINTNSGEEEVYMMRGEEKINLINYMMGNSIWLQLLNGINELEYVGSGAKACNVHITYANEYKGV